MRSFITIASLVFSFLIEKSFFLALVFLPLTDPICFLLLLFVSNDSETEKVCETLMQKLTNENLVKVSERNIN